MDASLKSESSKPDARHDDELDPLAYDPVIEVFKRDIDFSLVERNLRLTTEQRAEQLVKATRFIHQFRPLVAGRSPKTS